MKGTRLQTVMTLKGMMNPTMKEMITMTYWHFLAFVATWRHSNARPLSAGRRYPHRGDPTRMKKWQMRWIQMRTHSLGVWTPGICLALLPTASWPRSKDPQSPSTSALRPPFHPSRLPPRRHPRRPSPRSGWRRPAGRSRAQTREDSYYRLPSSVISLYGIGSRPSWLPVSISWDGMRIMKWGGKAGKTWEETRAPYLEAGIETPACVSWEVFNTV